MTQAKLLLLSILIMLCFSSAAGASSSFFTDAEIRSIEDQVKRSPALFKQQTKYIFHLSSILYFAENNWVLWAQGEKWTPDKQHDLITIQSVTPHRIYLSLKLRNGNVLDGLALAPNQSLNLITGQITEGE